MNCSRSSSVAQTLCSTDCFQQALGQLLATCDKPSDAPAPGSMGDLEIRLKQDGRELLRLSLEHATQKRADSCPPVCRKCGATLKKVSSGHERLVQTIFGQVRLVRIRGWCPHCKAWQIPADEELELGERAKASPAMQELCALLTSQMPAQQAAALAQHLLGVGVDDSTLAREAHRQGEKALACHQAADDIANDPDGRWDITRSLEDLPSSFVLVIMIDAWMIRERDEGGRTEELLANGTPASRWHWVRQGTVFRLDERGCSASGRPLIVSRGYVSTRQGGEAFSRQLYGEAVRRGLLKASRVLVVADGAAWIWNIVGDRFSQAIQRLDCMHAAQHLYVVADAVYGPGNEEGRKWARTLRGQMLEDNGEQVQQALAQLLKTTMEPDARETLEREANYFENHKDRMDYAQGRRLGEPIGSGAIESTCRQAQCRFKRCGMFWSTSGDEALLALETQWRNNRWRDLYPHQHLNPYSMN